MGSNPFKVTQCLCTSVGSSTQLVSWRLRGFKSFQSDNVSRRETDYLVALIVRDSFKEQPLEPVVDVSSKFSISEKRSFL